VPPRRVSASRHGLVAGVNIDDGPADAVIREFGCAVVACALTGPRENQAIDEAISASERAMRSSCVAPAPRGPYRRTPVPAHRTMAPYCAPPARMIGGRDAASRSWLVVPTPPDERGGFEKQVGFR
jgi:hypothetical protein